MESYWTNRYQTGETGWDIGYASPQMIAAAEKHDRNAKILIPGAGHAYEAESLWKDGFRNLFVCDISHIPLNRFQERVPDFPKQQLLHADFFDLEGDYEVILEHTFFCSFNPDRRDEYVQHAADLLIPGGTLTGLLFDFPLSEEGPPFGGSQQEYERLFSTHFEIVTMERSQLSIKPRSGNELFFEMTKCG